MSFKITPDEYSNMVKKASPDSSLIKDMAFAFVIGGLICVIGQIVKNFYTSISLSEDEVSAFTCVTMIFFGAVLTAFNVYGDIARYAGAGTLVPITGFSNSVVSSAMEFKSEGFVLGMGTKIFIIAGPVIVFGTVSGVVVGIIKYIEMMAG